MCPQPPNRHAEQDTTNPGGYVAIAHYDDSHARLLRRAEVLHIFSQTASSAGGGGIPCVLQVYVPPAHGLRYVVSYAYEGSSMAARVEVTPRPFAARYPPNPPPCAAAAMAAATAIQATGVHGQSLAEDLGGRGGLLDWVVPPPAMPPCSGSAAALASTAATTTGATVVPPSESGVEGRRVREQMHKAVSAIVQFVERSHGLMQTGAFEFVVGFEGNVQLIGISRVQWLKNPAPRARPAGAGVNVAQQTQTRNAHPGAPAGAAGFDTGGMQRTFGDFGEEDVSFFEAGATVTTAVEGRTVRTPYSTLYGGDPMLASKPSAAVESVYIHMQSAS